jgi:hypothetical protein
MTPKSKSDYGGSNVMLEIAQTSSPGTRICERSAVKVGTLT